MQTSSFESKAWVWNGWFTKWALVLHGTFGYLSACCRFIFVLAQASDKMHWGPHSTGNNVEETEKKHHHHTTVSGWEQFLWSSALFFLGGYSLANWCEGTQSFKRLRKIIGQKDVWSYCIILWHFSLRLNSCTVLSKRETLSLSHISLRPKLHIEVPFATR